MNNTIPVKINPVTRDMVLQALDKVKNTIPTSPTQPDVYNIIPPWRKSVEQTQNLVNTPVTPTQAEMSNNVIRKLIPRPPVTVQSLNTDDTLQVEPIKPPQYPDLQHEMIQNKEAAKQRQQEEATQKETMLNAPIEKYQEEHLGKMSNEQLTAEIQRIADAREFTANEKKLFEEILPMAAIMYLPDPLFWTGVKIIGNIPRALQVIKNPAFKQALSKYGEFVKKVEQTMAKPMTEEGTSLKAGFAGIEQPRISMTKINIADNVGRLTGETKVTMQIVGKLDETQKKLIKSVGFDSVFDLPNTYKVDIVVNPKNPIDLQNKAAELKKIQDLIKEKIIFNKPNLERGAIGFPREKGKGMPKEPEIIQRVLENPMEDIGQFSDIELKQLNKAVKDGILDKGKGGVFPATKTIYAQKGFDFVGHRNQALAELQRVEKYKPAPTPTVPKEQPKIVQIFRKEMQDFEVIESAIENLKTGGYTDVDILAMSKDDMVKALGGLKERIKNQIEKELGEESVSLLKEVHGQDWFEKELKNAVDQRIYGEIKPTNVELPTAGKGARIPPKKPPAPPIPASEPEPLIPKNVIPPEEVLTPTNVIPPRPPNKPLIPTNVLPPSGNPSDAEKKLIEALKGAKVDRKLQEKLYSRERGRRIAKASAIGNTIPGRKGFYKQKGALKGEFPKIQFESIASKVTENDITALFNQVQQARITEFEKITAKTGLDKLLGIEGSALPTTGEMDLLNEIFSPEFIRAIMDKRDTMQKFWGMVGEVINLPRAMMATADLSAPMRQGIFLIGKPKTWLPAFKGQFRYAFSEKAYQGMMDEIKLRPTYLKMREGGLSLTSTKPLMTGREEAFMSNLAEKIPVFGRLAKGSNRAYSGFLNKLRADTFDDLYKYAKDNGLLKENPNMVKDIAKFVNSATGRGSIGEVQRVSVILNGLFFSPRLMWSRLNLLWPGTYITKNSVVRKELLKDLLVFTGTGLTMLTLAKLGGAEVGIDPRSADFGKIKVGETRFDIWGGFQQYFVLVSRLITNSIVSSTTGREMELGKGYKPTTKTDIIQRFFESKSSPMASFIIGLLRGQTNLGEEFQLAPEIIDRFIPMIIQDMFDLYKERGIEGLPMAIPGVFGIGSQTYSDKIPYIAMSLTGKRVIKWRSAPSIGESIISKVTGEKPTTIPESEWADLKKRKDIKSERAYQRRQRLKERAKLIKEDLEKIAEIAKQK